MAGASRRRSLRLAASAPRGPSASAAYPSPPKSPSVQHVQRVEQKRRSHSGRTEALKRGKVTGAVAAGTTTTTTATTTTPAATTTVTTTTTTTTTLSPPLAAPVTPPRQTFVPTTLSKCSTATTPPSSPPSPLDLAADDAQRLDFLGAVASNWAVLGEAARRLGAADVAPRALAKGGPATKHGRAALMGVLVQLEAGFDASVGRVERPALDPTEPEDVRAAFDADRQVVRLAVLREQIGGRLRDTLGGGFAAFRGEWRRIFRMDGNVTCMAEMYAYKPTP